MTTTAILGASSQIAKDYMLSVQASSEVALLPYVRDPSGMDAWLAAHGMTYRSMPFSAYGQIDHDAVINFVGVGDPQRAAAMGGSILEITMDFDGLVLRELARHPKRRYIFLSSGAAYGSSFLEPANAATVANISINALNPQEYYAVAKLHAEARHRALADLAITDIRVFNYFSRTQSLEARFFITDIVRAIRDGQLLRTSPDFMVRDFLHPSDFHQLVACILAAPVQNDVLDCYSKAPIDKPGLLHAMQAEFGLKYEVQDAGAAVNATGQKPNYYSLNHKAAAYGYKPFYSSLDGIITETRAILHRA